MVGNKVMAGRLSVCPPESASTVRSCAIGICFASSASSLVIAPCANNSFNNFSGGGLNHLLASSTRDALAMIRLGTTILPCASL